MDIGSGRGYPSSSITNFAPHTFTFDGVACNSMEGLLQSFKFANPQMQEHVCTLVGIKAKLRGKPKRWQVTQTLYWKGEAINRHSQEYQDLLDRAYNALAQNEGFRRALLATGNAVLTHSIGRTNDRETVLTQREFVSRLTKIRERLQRETSST